jgi:hypothetical protein
MKQERSATVKFLKIYGEKRRFFGLKKTLDFIAEVSVQDGKLMVETDNNKLKIFLETGIKLRLEKGEMSFGRGATENNPDGSGKHYDLVIKTDLSHPEFLISVLGWLYELRNEDKLPFGIDPDLSKIEG